MLLLTPAMKEPYTRGQYSTTFCKTKAWRLVKLKSPIAKLYKADRIPSSRSIWGMIEHKIDRKWDAIEPSKHERNNQRKMRKLTA
jgi:hypothetical protein